jgi:hypothetical protein
MNRRLSQRDLDLLYRAEPKANRKSQADKSEEHRNVNNSRRSMFLCHSHLDKTIVAKILILFQKLNVDLYIDWMDVDLPVFTDKNTASIVKSKIDNSDKFLFLATYNALRSKWCNWELGLAYSSKGENDFAVLPIESRTGNWKGNEYLELYPEMQLDFLREPSTINVDDLKINFYNERLINFDKWLDGKTM